MYVETVGSLKPCLRAGIIKLNDQLLGGYEQENVKRLSVVEL